MLLTAINESPTPVRWFVVAAEPVTRHRRHLQPICWSSWTMSCSKAGIELVFAEMKDPVKDKLKRFGLFTRLGSELFFPTIGEAVNAYLEMSRVEWVDWEERSN